MTAPPTWRRCIHGLVAVGLATVVSLLLAETSVRVYEPKPRMQVVRGFSLHTVDGVPLWEQAADRQNRGCVEQHPDRIRVLFFGSSITFGSGLTAAEAFTRGLEQRLNGSLPAPGFCVLNFAQPGFTFEQKYALLRIEVARYRPALVMWEDWVEWLDYAMLGSAAYGTADFRRRSDGFIGIEGVPDGVNRALFIHSRFYQTLTITFGERAPRPPEREEVSAFTSERLIRVPALTDSYGARLALYLAPPLDRPFTETAAHPPVWQDVMGGFARDRRIAAYPLQRELIEEDYLAVRQDPCCHFNARGHRALAISMERIVVEQLADRLAAAR